MKCRIQRICVLLGALLTAPAVAQADFSATEIPMFVQDQAPNWLFQILSSIMFALAEVLFELISGGSAA